jgi:hypothetical protein
MSGDTQKWLLSVLKYHFDEIRAKLQMKKNIDPETKGAYIILKPFITDQRDFPNFTQENEKLVLALYFLLITTIYLP